MWRMGGSSRAVQSSGEVMLQPIGRAAMETVVTPRWLTALSEVPEDAVDKLGTIVLYQKAKKEAVSAFKGRSFPMDPRLAPLVDKKDFHAV
ncbi:hypothetical protein KIL84_002402 [Mauremys mutica]|uniref:Uncharacterized protein n=1 Tax=Mauremys mutica TaxID=74926 RepID=A0A9D3X7D8_9SAUR|nr:hypothetical protein KIL84_002402 [Mauremys mutica]